MKSLAPRDRPREKLDRFGSSILGDNELIAVILGHGFPEKTPSRSQTGYWSCLVACTA